MKQAPFNQSNTILYCECWAQTVDFYRHVLALPVSMEKDWFVEFQITSDSFLSVADAARASINTSRGAGLTLTLRVRDIEAVHERLAAAGAEVPGIARHSWGARRFLCRDPEGYRLEFWQPEE